MTSAERILDYWPCPVVHAVSQSRTGGPGGIEQIVHLLRQVTGIALIAQGALFTSDRTWNLFVSSTDRCDEYITVQLRSALSNLVVREAIQLLRESLHEMSTELKLPK